MNTKLKNIFFEDSKAKMIIRNGEVIYRMLVKPIFIVDTDNIEFESSGGTTTFNITANDSWSMTIPNFVTVSSLTGYGNATITVTTTGETSETELTGNIVITCGSKTHTIAVTQKSSGPDYSKMFFTIEVLSAGTIYFKKNTAAAQTCSWSCRTNGGNWETKTSDTGTTSSNSLYLSDGDIVEIRKTSENLTSGDTTYYNYFDCTSSAKFNIYGNIMSIADNTNEDDDLTTKSLTRNYQCYRTFYSWKGLVNASNLVFPNNITQYCYYSMFQGCTSLTTAPELPAITLAEACYLYMFQGCTSLVTAPELPATTLANACYQRMFYGCTSLTTAPSSLPATTLSNQCYYEMFYNCRGLTSTPALPATTLANRCYWGMFSNCSSLTTAPELPATTLADYCYYNMFQGCTNLNYIKCLATDISASNCTINWVSGVSATGTFVKALGMSGWSSGNSGIPDGWTVQEE